MMIPSSILILLGMSWVPHSSLIQVYYFSGQTQEIYGDGNQDNVDLRQQQPWHDAVQGKVMSSHFSSCTDNHLRMRISPFSTAKLASSTSAQPPQALAISSSCSSVAYSILTALSRNEPACSAAVIPWAKYHQNTVS